MDDVVGIILAVTGVVLLPIILWCNYRRPASFPPGPPNLPLLGSLPFVTNGPKSNLVSIFKELQKKHGDIFSLRLGNRWTVVLCDYDSMKEACLTKGKEFAGRPEFPMVNDARPTFPDIKGIIMEDYNEEWKTQRHACVTLLKDLGYGKGPTETKMLEEAEYLKKTFQVQATKGSFDPAIHIISSVFNVICSLLVNQHYNHNDPTFQSLRRATLNAAKHFAKAQLYLPFMRCLPSYRKLVAEFKSDFKEIDDYLMKHVESSVDFSHGAPSTCFVDSYLKMMKSSDGMQNWILPIMEDFILAGMETTATTLIWAVYYMLANPEVQKRVQKELDSVIGPGRQTVLKDRAKLPYTEATLHEVMRLASTAPIGFPHKTMAETRVKDYIIPKDCDIVPFIWNVLNDAKYWPEPEVFKPERFLDEEGHFIKSPNLIPFGIGRRVCLGEQLARQELFIFFTAMFQSFTFSTPDGATLPPPKGFFAISNQPPKFDIFVTLR